MRIGVDLDGVCYKWSKTARYMLREMLPGSPYTREGPMGQEADGYDYIQRNIAPEHWKWLWTEGVRLGLFRHGHIIKGAVEGVNALAADGHDMIIVTHRPKAAVTDTLRWLAFADFPLAGVHILTDQQPKSTVPCDVYIDDKPENVVDMAENTDARLVALYDAPWNQAFNVLEQRATIQRVRTWKAFVWLVRDMK